MSLTNAEITERVSDIAAALAADGYVLTVEVPSAGRVTARIEATPEACAECLVPKQVMGGLIAQAISDPSLDAGAIEVVYPVESDHE
jgi:hypothetical protein